MSRADDIAALADHILRIDLADGEWHNGVGFGDWAPSARIGDALNLLLQREVIEEDTRRRVYRLTPTHTRQLSLTEEA